MRVRYGYRRLHILLCREGWSTNHKRIYRLYCEEGLSIRTKTPRRRRACRYRVGRPAIGGADDTWAMDFVSERLFDGRPFRILTIVDCHTREALATTARTNFRAYQVIEELDRLARLRGKPRSIRVDSHQIVSQIETGERQLKAEELLIIVQAFKVPLEVLINPFLISGEGSFSWRQKDVSGNILDEYELKAGEWIGAYRALRQENGERFRATLPRLALEKSSRFEDAIQAAESLAEDLDLGDAPATGLARAMEERLGSLVLFVDTVPGVSGAACQIPELGAVLINRREPKGRRSFDLAHELFHILTWTTMPPERLDGQAPKNRRVEQLADNFASALLAPSRTLDRMGNPDKELAAWLNETAGKLQMSAIALKWRMISSGRVTRQAGEAVADAELRFTGEASAKASPPPPLFSKSFVGTISHAIEKGNLSVRRAVRLTGLESEELGDLFETHRVSRPAEL